MGKVLFAHAIHHSSSRKDQPFIRINCGAIPENLIEFELFGYEKGAFNGAHKTGKKGKFELADKGTIFLDEVGDLPLNMQVKLLRALQEKEIERVGGSRLIHVDVRVIAATNHNLEELVKKGTFRQDLFYRLYVLNLHIDALRKRKSDIPLLVEHFSTQIHHQYGMYKKFSQEVLEGLKKYSWPGNIRELKNIVERMVITSEHEEVQFEDLPEYIHAEIKEDELKQYSKECMEYEGFTLKDVLEHVEKKMIHDTLKECHGNKAQTATQLGIPRMSLYRKIEKYQISQD